MVFKTIISYIFGLYRFYPVLPIGKTNCFTQFYPAGFTQSVKLPCQTCLQFHIKVGCVFRYGRRNVVALGKFALNLTGFPRDRGSDLVAHLSCLLSTIVTKVNKNLLQMTTFFKQYNRLFNSCYYIYNKLYTGGIYLVRVLDFYDKYALLEKADRRK